MDTELLRNFRVGQLAVLGADKQKSNYLWLDGIDRITFSEHRHITQISLYEDEVWVSSQDEDDDNIYRMPLNYFSDSIIKEITDILFGKALEIASKMVMSMGIEDKIKYVKITTENNIKLYQYKGITIDKVTWEEAPCPMYCDNIDDDTMCKIVILLYEILERDFGDDFKDYIDYNNGKELPLERTNVLENLDSSRWVVEEELFCEWGGIYYEDMSDEEYDRLTNNILEQG
jgi:hypothetical protein